MMQKKVIHSYWDCFGKSKTQGLNAYDILMWTLSVIKYKKYGFITKLYCDKASYEMLNKYHLIELYDEVDTELLEQDFNILKASYWAMPKILSYKHELELGSDCFVSDTDMIPFCNLERFFNYDLSVWSNDEHLEHTVIYLPKESLSTPKGYVFPKWFTWRATPLNSGIIYFKDKNNALEYCNEVIRYVTNNKNNQQNNTCQSMCFAEQRILGEYASYKQLQVGVVRPTRKSCLNKNAWHLFQHKLSHKKEEFEIFMLYMIKEENIELYNKIISIPAIAEVNNKYLEKGHIDAQNYVYSFMGVEY